MKKLRNPERERAGADPLTIVHIAVLLAFVHSAKEFSDVLHVTPTVMCLH